MHAFERLARELFVHGAPSQLMNDALEAAADEVEHAREIGALARAHGGEPVEAEVAALPSVRWKRWRPRTQWKAACARRTAR